MLGTSRISARLSSNEVLGRCTFIGVYLSLLAIGCASETGDGVAGQSDVNERATGQSLVRANAAPNLDQHEITIATAAAYTKCTLNAPNNEGTMPVWADDEGVVHLSAAATATSKRFSLECEEPNGSVQHSFDLAKADTFVPKKARVKSKDRTYMPGLSDPDGMTQDEVRAAGYPPRPDADDPQYALWRKMVTVPATQIAWHHIDGPSDARHDPGTTDSSLMDTLWGGMILHKARTRYTEAIAAFKIPAVSQQGTGTSIASFWTGLDGYGHNVIMQDGVDGYCTGGVCHYYPWIEYYPDPVGWGPLEMNAGDTVIFETWECDANGVYGSGHTGYGCFFWYDSTSGYILPTYIYPIPAGRVFTGPSCEAIIERVNDQYVSKWSGTLDIEFDCYVNGGTTSHSVQSDPYVHLDLENDAQTATLVEATKTNPDMVHLTWHHSH